MVGATLVDLIPYRLQKYSFKIVVNKHARSCSTTADQYGQIKVLSKIKDGNYKVANIIIK